jgi:NADP-dependent 3-hydroxy acid dehydrogenase YdfG
VGRTEKKLGEIDVLVNNAGTNYRRPFHMFKFEDLWRVIEVNFKAVLPLLGVRELLILATLSHEPNLAKDEETS